MSFGLITKISAQRKANGLTLTEYGLDVCLKIYEIVMDIAFRSSQSLSTYKRRVLKKNNTLHGKIPVLEFSFSLIFQKRDSRRSIFSRILQKILTKTFLKSSSGLLLLWLSNLSQQTKTFSKLPITQPIFWCLYYTWTCFYVFY